MLQMFHSTIQPAHNGMAIVCQRRKEREFKGFGQTPLSNQDLIIAIAI